MGVGKEEEVIMMNKFYKLVLAELLELAAKEFTNRGCNDFELPNTPENRKLVEDMHQSIGCPDAKANVSKDSKKIYTTDYRLMYYFVELLKSDN